MALLSCFVKRIKNRPVDDCSSARRNGCCAGLAGVRDGGRLDPFITAASSEAGEEWVKKDAVHVQDLGGDAIALLEDPQEQMLGLHGCTAQLASNISGNVEDVR